VCRDVWALHLSFLPEPVPAKPSGQTQRVDEAKNATPPVGGPEKEKQDAVEKSEEEGSSSSSSSDENDDPFLKALMRENSESPSSSDTSEVEDEDPKLSANKKEGLSRKQLRRYEGPRSTISVLMLACWIMRVPVMYRDFIMSVCALNHTSLNELKVFFTSGSLGLTSFPTSIR
jgi:RNA polymerase I-specific transcription initiation factor RRN7